LKKQGGRGKGRKKGGEGKGRNKEKKRKRTKRKQGKKGQKEEKARTSWWGGKGKKERGRGWVQGLKERGDDDCFYDHSWRNNVVIAFGTLSSFLT